MSDGDHKAVSKEKGTKREDESISQGLAIAALLLNVLVLPGLGSIIGGKTKEGIIQIILVLLSALLTFTFIGAVIGVPLGIVAWIWGLITGINLVKESK
ncbi:MAG: hypothetical protein GXN99_00220 [Candidatus Nanohaloarchaeota archaeon]|nr:hypothetical protein [Candidatus Nanohaloarchaeota archaeon]